MGKTMTKVRFWNVRDNTLIERGEKQPIEIEAQVDSGATLVVLPTSVAYQLGLTLRSKKRRVCYANMETAEREIAIGLCLEILGRATTTEAILEPQRTTPLIGQLAVEGLDLWIDSKNGRLIPNPEHGDEPIYEVY